METVGSNLSDTQWTVIVDVESAWAPNDFGFVLVHEYSVAHRESWIVIHDKGSNLREEIILGVNGNQRI